VRRSGSATSKEAGQMRAESSLEPPVQPPLQPPSLRAPCLSRSCWHLCDHQGSSCVIIILGDLLSRAKQSYLVVACRCSSLVSFVWHWHAPAHPPTVRQGNRCRTSSATTSCCKVGWVAVTVLCCQARSSTESCRVSSTRVQEVRCRIVELPALQVM